jgi:hypothetical protein
MLSANGFAAEFNYVPGTAGAAGFTDDRQHDIFGGDARCRFAFHFNLHGFGAALLQGLRRQNVFEVPIPNASAPNAPWLRCGSRRRRWSCPAG